jgi:hypothetical protein
MKFPEPPEEETTIDCDLDDFGRVVADIQDDSAGARTPQELAKRRARRTTVTSQVPSELARSMQLEALARRAREPAAAARATPEPALRSDGAIPVARRADETVPIEVSSAYIVETTLPAADTQAPVPVAALVERACACAMRGEIGEALVAAADAIALNDRRAEVDPGQLKDIVRGPLAPIFALGGHPHRTPVVARSETEMDALVLDELHWALLRRIDGQRTVDQIFAATKIPPLEALQVTASLFRSGVIRIENRVL